MFARLVFLLISSLCLLLGVGSFVSPSMPVFRSSPATTRRTSSLRMAEVVFPGGKKTQADAGTPLKAVAQKAKYMPDYGCEEGLCGACQHKMNGKKIRLCVGKLPRGAGPFTFTK